MSHVGDTLKSTSPGTNRLIRLKCQKQRRPPSVWDGSSVVIASIADLSFLVKERTAGGIVDNMRCGRINECEQMREPGGSQP